MKDRCYNLCNGRQAEYGGRGIKVCDEWKNSVANFVEWSLANGYRDGLTIDRIDVNGNYEPSNCRWATPKEQANNTRKNVFITYKGETHTVSEWSEIKGIKRSTLQARLRKWDDLEKVFEAPIQGENENGVG